MAVSNRLPIVMERRPDGWDIKPGSGGLVTALAPVLRNRGGLWIGWPGVTGEVSQRALDRASKKAGYRLHAVPLGEEEIEHFYRTVSNGALWPLFHGLSTRATYSHEAWGTYEKVNRRFAEVIDRRSRESDYIWVHDYHLMLVARELRALNPKRRIGFFLHIPFPPLDIFLQLPWRSQILDALLKYDLIGFQTMRDRRNFLDAVRRVVPNVRTHGAGSVVSVEHQDREVRIGAFPISIDYREFAEQASDWPVEEGSRWLKRTFGNRIIILGVDRLDYTKGIPERLEALRVALERYPELRGAISFIQIAVPSRQDVPEYRLLKEEIDRLVGDINGQFTEMDWSPIHYMYRSVSRDQLLTFYRAADIGLLTPLADGMNLVAKEFAAANVDQNGVLILSEFAGAASQLYRWALTVNPHNAVEVAEAIHEACTMSEGEKRYRMRRLRASIKRNDIFRWVDQFLEAAVARHLDDFPVQEDYVPGLEPTEV
ncbi:MAG: trehalose-6-phosphate synthase [Thermoleophilia bacterium]